MAVSDKLERFLYMTTIYVDYFNNTYYFLWH